MPRSAGGVATVPAGTTVVTSTTIESTKYNALLSDLESMLTDSLSRSGKGGMTANLAMSGFKLTGLAAGSTAGDSLRYEQLTAAIAALSSVYQPLDSDLTSIAALATTSYGRGLLTSASALALQVQTGEFMAGLLFGALSNRDYRLVVKIPHGGTITEVVTRCVSGTATATFKINTTALGGTANAVSSTEQAQAHSTANAFVTDDDIVVTISANSVCVDMSFTIKYTRTLL